MEFFARFKINTFGKIIFLFIQYMECSIGKIGNCLPVTVTFLSTTGTTQSAIGWHFRLHGWLCRTKRMHARQLQLTRTDLPVTGTTLSAAGIDLTALATEITLLAIRMTGSYGEALPATNLYSSATVTDLSATGTALPALQ
jgi:hypothetical protein